jgi:hypothetical protein
MVAPSNRQGTCDPQGAASTQPPQPLAGGACSCPWCASPLTIPDNLKGALGECPLCHGRMFVTQDSVFVPFGNRPQAQDRERKDPEGELCVGWCGGTASGEGTIRLTNGRALCQRCAGAILHPFDLDSSRPLQSYPQAPVPPVLPPSGIGCICSAGIPLCAIALLAGLPIIAVLVAFALMVATVIAHLRHRLLILPVFEAASEAYRQEEAECEKRARQWREAHEYWSRLVFAVCDYWPPVPPGWDASRGLCYPPDWDQRRKLVLERDGNECTNTFCPNKGQSVELHVHHVVPLSLGGNNCLQNLVTLCWQCHGAEPGHEKVLRSYADRQHRFRRRRR